jgi:decaprenyl-phosphate phosphoribosyltransferase
MPMHGSSIGLERTTLSQLVRLVRPRQWIKNAFVAAPLFFTPEAVNLQNLGLVAAATAIFCVASSAIYIFNDLFDRDADRLHPAKASRPVASGAVPVAVAWSAFGLLAMLALGGAVWLSRNFAFYVVGYLILQTAYSSGLKHVAVLDVMIIAVGFVLRIFAGSVLIAAVPSPWIVIATGLVASFLALAKRRDDLVMDIGVSHRRSLGGYTVEFLDTAIAVLLAALLVSYLMYTTSEAVIARLGTPHLYISSVFVVAGVLRYLQLAIVFRRTGSPTDVMLGDWFMIATCTGWVLAMGCLIYG